MNKLLNKFLIVLVGIILLSGLYIFFSNGLKSEAADANSSLSSSTGADPASTVVVDQQIAEETSFLTKLASLSDIKIDTSLFTDKLFTDLTDNNVQIDIGDVGRPNPFALVDANAAKNVAAFAPGVITNDATQITDKSAVLNGTVNGPNVTASYFEYGPTNAFGKTTPLVKQSLTGIFVSAATGLVSKTQYFYRAVSRVNGVLINGDVVTFTTI